MLVPLAWLKASRRAMQGHQHVPPTARTPLRTLLWGEVVWAVRQVRGCRWVAAGLGTGFVLTLAVFGSAAPGPSLGWQWRLLLASGAGWVVAAAARGVETAWAARSSGTLAGGRPVLGAAELSGLLVICVLVGWLTMWAAAAARLVRVG